MHRGASSRTRGASIVGAVLLVALISAAAVAIDSTHLGVQTDSLVAATCRTFEGRQICDKDGWEDVTINGQSMRGVRINSEAYKDVTCLIGQDFIVDVPRGVLFYADQNGNRASGPHTQCVPGVQSVKSKDIVSRQCISEGMQAWECYIIQCRKTANGTDTCEVLSRTNGTGSRKPLAIGDKIASSTAITENLANGSSLGAEDVKKILSDVNATPEQRAAAEKALTSFDTETQRGILGESQTLVNEEIALQENIRDGADRELSAIARGDCTVSTAGSCEQELEAATKRKAAAEEEIQRLNAQRVRLAAAQETLKAPTKPPGGGDDEGDSYNKRNPYFGPGDWTGGGQQVVISTGYGPASGTGNDPYCIVSNQPLIVHNYAARPGCLNYRPQSALQQQCGTTGSGGLIGTIVSLFRKSNANCQNGNNGPTPTCTITASPTSISAGGQPVTLTWQSQQAFSANLSSMGNVAPQGSVTVNPQTTTTYTLQVDGYHDSYSGKQLRGQCSVQVVVGGQGGGDGAPKAEISCRPEVADVGMSMAISFACRNSATSGGTGFDTNGQLSGSATPVIESPTIGSNNVVKYGLTCSKEGKTDTAECTVQVNKTSIVLIANPREVQSGGEANIGWVTGGMEECTIASPTLSGFTAENAGNTSTSGVAKTPPLTQETKFVLSCTTKSGGTKTAETTVQIR